MADHASQDSDVLTLYFEYVSTTDPIRLPGLVRKAFAYPRFLSIGSENNIVEVRMERETYEQIKAIIDKPGRMKCWVKKLKN